MELVSKSGKIDGRYCGIFKCPACHENVVKPLSDGRSNKSCGKQACKSIMSPKDRIQDLEFYRAFSEKYRNIKTTYTLCAEWRTMQGFIDTMYNGYVKARKYGAKISFSTTGRIPTPHNSYWKIIKGTAKPKIQSIRNFDIDYTSDRDVGIYHLKMVSDHFKREHIRVLRRMRKLQATTNFGDTKEYIADIKSTTSSYKSKTELLTKRQYDLLISVLTITSNKKASTYLYLIKSLDKIKIGITHDVEKRRKSLYYSAVTPMDIVFKKEFNNARVIEKELHKKYAEYNSHGEWFNLTQSQIQEITEYLDNLN